jgi:hypothetical protein
VIVDLKIPIVGDMMYPKTYLVGHSVLNVCLHQLFLLDIDSTFVLHSIRP